MFRKIRTSFTTAVAALIVCTSAVLANDFDNDGRSDFGFFRPSTGVWYTQSSIEGGAFTAFRWGVSNDVLVPADYDGDGQTDVAVWRPADGTWHIRCSREDKYLSFRWGMTTSHPTGGLADVPVPADYDGDGLDDVAIWRPDTGEWHILATSKGFNRRVFVWGKLGDVPVPADYDGDGQSDFAVFRPAENRWYIVESKSENWQIRKFGSAGSDVLVPADYTGDGKADIAVYRSGIWYVLNSTTSEIEPFELGFADAIPAPADYDGDGHTDFAVYRKGVWYIYESKAPRLRSFSFGREGDIPLNSLNSKESMVAVP